MTSPVFADPAPAGGRGRRAAAILLPLAGAAGLLWLGFGPEPEARRPDAIVVLPGGGQGSAAPAPGTAAASGVETPGRRFASLLTLQPWREGDRLIGYVITAETPADALAATGLRQGDILLDLDGRPLGPDRVAALADELAGADSLELTFERQGQLRKRTVDLTR